MPRSIRTHTVKVGSLEIGGGRRFTLIAGPCVIENEEHPFFMAEKIQAITRDLGIPYIFKASFDKANRTAIDSFRGPGMEEGLAILKGVGERFGVPVTTDVHELGQAEPVPRRSIFSRSRHFSAGKRISSSARPRPEKPSILRRASFSLRGTSLTPPRKPGARGIRTSW